MPYHPLLIHIEYQGSMIRQEKFFFREVEMVMTDGINDIIENVTKWWSSLFIDEIVGCEQLTLRS